MRRARRTECYVDDCLTYSRSIGEHLRDLRVALQCLETAGIKLRRDKCRFGYLECEFLGSSHFSRGTISDAIVPREDQRISYTEDNFRITTFPRNGKLLPLLYPQISEYRESPLRTDEKGDTLPVE